MLCKLVPLKDDASQAHGVISSEKIKETDQRVTYMYPLKFNSHTSIKPTNFNASAEFSYSLIFLLVCRPMILS